MPAPQRRWGRRLAFGEPYKNAYENSICLTLEEDEVTPCWKPVPAGGVRCHVHQMQYRTMYLRYKEASMRAKELKQAKGIPTKDEIDGYNEFGPIVRNLDHVRKYRELVQIEKIGRDIHGRRFFLEPDAPHAYRLEVVKEEINRASKAFHALKDRAKTLHLALSRRRRGTRASRGHRLDRSDNMSVNVGLEGTSGTTLDAHQGASFEASGLNFKRTTTTGKLADYAKEIINVDSDSDDDSDDDLIELDITMASAELFYASVDYLFSK